MNDPAPRPEDLTPEERAALADPDNAAEPLAIRAKRKKVDQQALVHDEVMRALLQTPTGREWLSWLMFDVCGLFRTTANAAFDAQAMFFREGAREVGSLLQKAALRADATQYMVFLTENREKM